MKKFKFLPALAKFFLLSSIILIDGLGGEHWTGLYSRVQRDKFDAHDGNILYHKGTYYWYGMAYTDCEISATNISLRSWQCKQLEHFVKTVSADRISGFSCGMVMFPTRILSKDERCGFLYSSEEQLPYVWQSTDLINWSRVDEVEPKSGGIFGSSFKSLQGKSVVNGKPLDISKHIIFRPHVSYNEKNDEFIMWVNAIPGGHVDRYPSIFEAYVYGAFAVLRSKNAEGPFELINMPDEDNPGLLEHQVPRGRGPGDFGMMTHDGKGYAAYGSWNNGAFLGWTEWTAAKIIDVTMYVLKQLPNWVYEQYGEYVPTPLQLSKHALTAGHVIAIQQLDDNYYGFKPGSELVDVTPRDYEAPSVFARKDDRTGSTWFYLLAGKMCCFCAEGSDMQVWVARDDPLGMWVNTDIHINTDEETEELLVKSQSNSVNVVRGKHVGMPEKENVYLWTGDLWHSSRTYYGRDTKAYDLQNWQVLDWNHDHTLKDFPKQCYHQDEKYVKQFGLESIPMPCQLTKSRKTKADKKSGSGKTEL